MNTIPAASLSPRNPTTKTMNSSLINTEENRKSEIGNRKSQRALAAGSLPLGTRLSTVFTALFFAFLLLVANVPTASAATKLWNNSGNGSWNTAANWSASGIPDSTSDVLLDNSLVTLPSPLGLDAAFTVKTITLNTGASDILQANTSGNTTRALTLNGNGAGTADLIAVSGNSTLTLQSGGTTGTLSLALGDSGKFNVGTGSTLDIQSVISGSAKSLEKNGAGTLILRGTNTFNGGFIQTAGTTSIAATGALGNATNTITLVGGTLRTTASAFTVSPATLSITGDVTFGGSGSGVITFSQATANKATTGDRVLTFDTTGTTFSTGALTLGGNLTTQGTGLATFSGGLALNGANRTLANSLTGVLTVGAVSGTGNFQFDNTSTAVPVLNGGFTNSGNVTFNANNGTNITVSTVSVNNTGSITNSGSSTGTTTIATVGTNVTGITQASNTSALVITNALTGLGGTNTFNISKSNIAITGSANLTLTGGVNNIGTITNDNTGTGTLTVGPIGANVTNVTQNSATSTMVLNGASTTYNNANGYNITAGTLKVSDASVFTAGTKFTLASGGRLDVNVANQSLAKLAAGTGSGVVAGSFLRYSQVQTSGTTGPGTITGTVELNITNVNPNYTLDFGNGSTLTNLVTSTYTAPITLSGNASIDSSSAVATYSTGGITASTAGAKTLTLTGSNTGANTISSVIGDGSGSLAITKTGSGTWTLSGNNTFTGGVVINSGTLKTANDSNTGALGQGNLTINGGELSLVTNTSVNYARNTTVAGDATITSVRANASSGGITYTFGSLAIGAHHLTAQGGSSNGNLGLAFGATTLTGNAIFTSDLNVATSMLLTLASLDNGGFSPTFNGTGNATVTGVVSGTGGLTKAGAGTLTLNGANTITGNVTVAEGTLRIGNVSGMNVANVVTVGGNGTAPVLDINKSNTIAGLNDGGFTNGTVTNTSTAITLTLGGSGTYSYGGIITATTPANLKLTKNGTGTQTLGGTNTYTGNTTISQGTLIIDGSLAAGSAVSVSSLATLGGIGTVNGLTTLSAVGSIINPGTAGTVGSLALTGGLTASSGGAFNFDLSGGVTDHISLGAGGLTAGGTWTFTLNNLGGMSAGTPYTLLSGTGTWSSTPTLVFNLLGGLVLDTGYNGTGYKWDNTLGADSLTVQFSAIPEPQTWALLAFSLTTVMILRRRRNS